MAITWRTAEARRRFLLALALVLISFSAFGFYRGISGYLVERRTARWSKLVGTVHARGAKPVKGTEGDIDGWLPTVTYKYVVHNNTYYGKKIGFFDPTVFELKSYALEQYREGDPVVVYYNPERPEEAALVLPKGGGHLRSYAPAAVLLLLGLGLLVLWRLAVRGR